MTVYQLIKCLLRVWLKYGNIAVHMTIEIPPGGSQYAARLGEVAVSPGNGLVGRPARVELLSEGFT